SALLFSSAEKREANSVSVVLCGSRGGGNGRFVDVFAVVAVMISS
ncbi:hypothetical protein Tco_0220587, partial [Tanacetum coccineum]